MNGHMYDIELTMTVVETAKVRVFIPDDVKTADGQKAFAMAQAGSTGAWKPEKTSFTVSSLSRKERASIVLEDEGIRGV